MSISVKIPTQFAAAVKCLEEAKCPEEIFGARASVKQLYKEWAAKVHPDKVAAKLKKQAHEAFTLLQKRLEQAEEKIARGTYGDGKPFVLATLRTKTTNYEVSSLLWSCGLSNWYKGQSDKGVDVIVRVVRSAANNDLMKNEADILAALPAKLDIKLHGYFPNLLDSFEIAEGKTRRRVNVFSYNPKAYSLAEVIKENPMGLDPRDATWMWNRALEALSLLGSQGYVFNALTPERVIIVPDNHAGTIIDFCYAVKVGHNAKAFISNYRNWYGMEVITKQPLTKKSDSYMAGQLMTYLVRPSLMPIATYNLLRTCYLHSMFRDSPHQLFEAYKKICRELYGPKKFREFKMPARSI